MSEKFRVSLPGGENFTASPDENLLAAAQRAHWLIRYGCRNGNCEACAAMLTAGRVHQRGHDIDAAQGEQEILLCLAHACSDVQIELPGNPLHGSAEHAQRSYAQLRCATVLPAGGCELTFQLPAGKQLPLHAGQTVLLETQPPLRADIGVGALNGRELTVVSDAMPALAVGDRVHLRYPLGYTYRISTSAQSLSAQSLYVLCETATQARALRLQAWLEAAAVIDMSRAAHIWPPQDQRLLIIALAQSESTVRQWYAKLLASGVRFTEMRSDFVILQPWRVCRQDDNGNRFVMAAHLDEKAARAQAQMYTGRGHKQLYWAEPDSLV